jgi:hypothetical protein
MLTRRVAGVLAHSTEFGNDLKKKRCPVTEFCAICRSY